MGGKRKALEIAHSLYEGVLTAGGWGMRLSRFVRLPSRLHRVMLRDRRTKVPHLNEHANMDPQLIAEYVTYYYAHDPEYDISDRFAVGDWYIDWRDLDRKTLLHGEFHQVFLPSHGLNSVQALPLYKTDQLECFLSLQSGNDVNRRFMPDQSQILRWLQPHLEQAVLLRQAFHRIQRQSAIVGQALDAFTFPVLIVNESGAVQLANRTGEEWLAIKGNPFTGQGMRQTCKGTAAIAKAWVDAWRATIGWQRVGRY